MWKKTNEECDHLRLRLEETERKTESQRREVHHHPTMSSRGFLGDSQIQTKQKNRSTQVITRYSRRRGHTESLSSRQQEHLRDP